MEAMFFDRAMDGQGAIATKTCAADERNRRSEEVESHNRSARVSEVAATSFLLAHCQWGKREVKDKTVAVLTRGSTRPSRSRRL
jgi:hypothetical protein